MSNASKWQVRFCKWDNGTTRTFKTCGRVAQTIVALDAAKARGVTAAELSCWAYRLGAYVHLLRHDYGLEIITLREEHDGGWHGRYVLVTPVEILHLDKT